MKYMQSQNKMQMDIDILLTEETKINTCEASTSNKLDT